MTNWLLVALDFTPLGGMDYANYALAKYLATRGDTQVHLVTHRAWPDLTALPSVRLHQVSRPFGRQILGVPLIAQTGRRWARRLGPQGARVLVNGGNCVWGDVNWVHYVHAAHQPVVASSLYQIKTSLMHYYDLAKERESLARSRVVLCNSRRTRQDVVERLGIPESRTHVIYYGADPARFAPPTKDERAQARTALGWRQDHPVVVFVGGLGNRRKGFDTLFAAWRLLCQKPAWDCDLAVVGAGREVLAWRQRAAAVGLEDRIKFLGFRNDVPAVLAACDAMVHPARYEAYGLGVQEAICRGLPTLVSATAGVAERYPPELQELLLPNPDDARDLAERLRRWHQRIEYYRESVAAFSQALRSHTWDHMAAQIQEVVENGR